MNHHGFYFYLKGSRLRTMSDKTDITEFALLIYQGWHSPLFRMRFPAAVYSIFWKIENSVLN